MSPMKELLDQFILAMVFFFTSSAIVALFGLSMGVSVSEHDEKEGSRKADFLFDLLTFGGLGTLISWLFRKIMNLPRDK